VTADPTQLRQILLNLITNAAEAVSSGSIVIVSTGQETLSEADLSHATHGVAASPGRHVFLEVSDQGTGIRPDCIRQVFEPFFYQSRKPRSWARSMHYAATAARCVGQHSRFGHTGEGVVANH
jgi:C4-dicarboxylate-specific signal transduction histidine kinase